MRNRQQGTRPRRLNRKPILRPIRPPLSLKQRNPRPRSKASEDKPSNPADDAATTITKTVNEVNVVFTVTDKHGRYVRNLAKRDFAVIDDGKPAEQIRSFHNETDLPLQVGLLVDASNSIRDVERPAERGHQCHLTVRTGDLRERVGELRRPARTLWPGRHVAVAAAIAGRPTAVARVRDVFEREPSARSEQYD